MQKQEYKDERFQQRNWLPFSPEIFYIYFQSLVHHIRFSLSAFSLLMPLSVLMIITGCAVVGPDYSPPQFDSPQAWHSRIEDGLKAEGPDSRLLTAWWETFDDPLLNQLMTRAVQGNLDLKEAMTRVRKARAERGLSRTALFPTLDVTGTATKSRSSQNSGMGEENELYSAGFDAGWELDIFGGVRRSIEAADADLDAVTADLNDVLVTLMAETGLNYIDVRAYQTRLDVALANLASQQKTSQLIQSRYDAGLSNELEVQQARYNLESTRSQLPSLRSGLNAALNRLAILLGETPGSLHDELQEHQPIPVPPLTVAVGVPAEALRRRPDIRSAERNLAAQTARIGVATADLYPKFSLSGSIGLESLEFHDLMEDASHTWKLGPRFSWNIFDAGAIRRNIEVQSALQEQALIQYESSILTALEEVENALVAYYEEQNRRNALEKATEAALSAAQLSQEQYKAGLVDFSDVLDAQRSLLSFEDQLAESNGKVTSNLMQLYKALGGGWNFQAMPAATAETVSSNQREKQSTP
jgi:NodT family efflux transporter outer membrane factor (OMF) lipoprotein